MQIYNSFDNLPEIKNPVVTTGSFDGVHAGHHVILSRLSKLAKDLEGESVLVTFHPHPRRILYPEKEGKDLMLINSQEEKKMLLEETGLDHLIIINFTLDFAKTSCEEFIMKYLYKKLGARKIVVGFNHQFGFNRTGNFDYLFKLSREYNFEVEEIPEQDIHNESVSSTKIRKALKQGNIQRANAYLDHYYLIKGTAEINLKRSRQLGREILNLNIDEDVKLVPADGLYAVNIHLEGKIMKGMFCINNNQIVNGLNNPNLELEFHCLGQNPIKAGKSLLIYFHKRIRSSKIYQDEEGMKGQVEKDIREIEELIF